MVHTISLTDTPIQRLDLTPAVSVIDPLLTQPASPPSGVKLRFEISIQRDPTDPRELSEIPEVRLWFIRLDCQYPWLPLFLDWENGELGRYAAMLVPHQFSPTEGIRYNPEALEIFVMQKVFVTLQWQRQQGITNHTRLKFMTQMLGYEIDDGFFQLLE
jgi:hypothetical protein